MAQSWDAPEPSAACESPAVVDGAANPSAEPPAVPPSAARGFARLDPEPELPPLYDPYVLAAPPSARPELPTSRLAVASVVTAFGGPLGAPVAIVLGLLGRRQVARGRARGEGLATAGIALGVLFALAWAAAGAALYLRSRITPPAVVASESPAPAPRPRSLPSAPTAEPTPRNGDVPEETTTRREGSVVVVDIGIKAGSLREELARQREDARKTGETLMVMTIGQGCAPCRDQTKALADPLLQTALAKVRVVRVDRDVFREDLQELRIPVETIPGFVLLKPDLSPRDGIDGGEWDDDVPQNIAPVLGAFVRGKYGKRRRPWHPLPGGGISL